jgi:hypothetical protein
MHDPLDPKRDGLFHARKEFATPFKAGTLRGVLASNVGSKIQPYSSSFR